MATIVWIRISVRYYLQFRARDSLHGLRISRVVALLTSVVRIFWLCDIFADGFLGLRCYEDLNS